MEISSLSSKPFHSLPLSRKWQRLPHHRMPVSVSCRATKLAGEDKTGNFYKILSLSPKNATMDEIKRAYRLMALRYHPDVCRDPVMKEESTRIFVQLNAAYEILSNPILRAEYDCEVLGLSSRRMSVGDEERRMRRWEEQVVELKRRSNRRMAQKGESWGSRMRAKNMENHS